MEKVTKNFVKKKTLSTVPCKRIIYRITEKIAMTDSALDKKEIHKYVLTEESSKTFALEWKKPPQNFSVPVGSSNCSVKTLSTYGNNTYLLTPWSRVLLEKLTGSAASQETPRIFGTRKFITVLTSARHLSLS